MTLIGAPELLAEQPSRYRSGGSRFGPAALSLGIQGLVAAVLIYGLVGPGAAARGPTTLVSVTLDRPPEPQPDAQPERPKAAMTPDSGAAAPAGRKAQASPIIAAPQLIPIPDAPPAPLTPGIAAGPSAGAAPVGLGSGAGGQGAGNGSGSGGEGTGNGDGAGGTEPEWTGGKIRDADYPKALRENFVSGITGTLVSVGTNGRPIGCRVIKRSGSAELDATTCRLVMERFKFRPARNAAGQLISSDIEYEQEWETPPLPPERP